MGRSHARAFFYGYRAVCWSMACRPGLVGAAAMQVPYAPSPARERPSRHPLIWLAATSNIFIAVMSQSTVGTQRISEWPAMNFVGSMAEMLPDWHSNRLHRCTWCHPRAVAGLVRRTRDFMPRLLSLGEPKNDCRRRKAARNRFRRRSSPPRSDKNAGAARPHLPAVCRKNFGKFPAR